MSALTPPPIVRRHEGAPQGGPPGVLEATSSLTEPGHPLSATPSHDSSSHSGSETVERLNPFEQMTSSHPSPDRVMITASTPASPQPSTGPGGGGGAVPRSPAGMPLVPVDVLQASNSNVPQMPAAEEDEDEFTHSSSAVNSTEPASSYTPSTGSLPPHHAPPPQATLPGVTQSFVRFLETTRKRISVHSRNTSEDDLMEDLDGMIIHGYLQKLGRNGKWQTRWFESDGECLSYYKNENRTKLLATLDLEKVGAIGLDPSDENECSFTIQVLGRLYHLRAENKVSCTDWVITLNRIKEAKMHQGNVKLVPSEYLHHHHRQQLQQPQQQQLLPKGGPVDLLDPTENLVAPRVVVVSNRQRTRAVAETMDFDNMMQDGNGELSHQMQTVGGSSKRLSTIGTVVLARWNKRRSSLSRLRSKFAKWARSLRNLSCMSEGNVALDNHVHPPGHDDDRKKKHLGWIGKETTSAAPDAAVAETAEDDKRMPRKMSSEEIRMLS